MPAAKSPAPAPGSGEKLDRLRTLLHEMFQLDRGDLDFGLYRIMNMKAEEIKSFLADDLLPQVQEQLQGISAEERERLEKGLSEAISQAKKLGGIDPEDTDRVKSLRKELKEAQVDAEAEADVYNHLANFFSRYYSEGDFMSLRRYSSGGKAKYLIPYNGEEVKLHWANADQYYIKTTENYASYIFSVSGKRRVRFEIATAENSKDNIKEDNGKQRRFLLTRAGSVMVEGNDLIIQFDHRSLTNREKRQYPGNGANQQSRINTAIKERILNLTSLSTQWKQLLSATAPTQVNGERTVLEQHLDRYTAKNSFDYFIHKDLGGFLRRELALYLKSEVLNLDDLDRGDTASLRRSLARVRTTRFMAEKIIVFLAQLEDFQKRLWLKKKFVLETQYCVTLDRVPEALYSTIIANSAQVEEWKELFAIEEIKSDLADSQADYSDPISPEFLKSNPYLVLDTRHFNADFTGHLLEVLSSKKALDDQLDGLLIHGENFQVLNLLQKRYQQQIASVYIDPPYNTDASAILYKNNYKNSSWLSLLVDRLLKSRNLIEETGAICVAIDDEEVAKLRPVLEQIFDQELGIAVVRSNPAGRKTKGKFSPAHEYALFFGKNGATPNSLKKHQGEMSRYPHEDEHGRYAWANFIRSGSGDKRVDRPHMYFPIYVGSDDTLRIPDMIWDQTADEYKILEEPKKGETAIWPILSDNGRTIEKRWHRGWERTRETIKSGGHRIRRETSDGKEKISIDFKTYMDIYSKPRTWWGDKKYASANLGAKMLKDLFGEKRFDFAKAPELVADCIRAMTKNEHAIILDYFAGAGTTGHAVIKLNREDGGKRKFILADMANYFDSVTLAHIKKIIYSRDWNEGKPISRHGDSYLLKYQRIESYEDTLDNLIFTSFNRNFLDETSELAEDYQLRYALQAESASSPCLAGAAFNNPFAYHLSVLHNGTRKKVQADLPETFNHLIGLRVESWHRIDDILAIVGTTMGKQRCLVLWRNLKTINNNMLEIWFAKNRARFPGSLDSIYVNGDHTLNTIRTADEHWVATTIEPIFRELMFEAS